MDSALASPLRHSASAPWYHPAQRGTNMSLRHCLLLFLIALPALADDGWEKLKDLPSGSDLKIYQLGSVQPKLAKFADVTDSNLIILVKNEQVALPKEGIDRIEARPLVKKSRKTVVRETHLDDPAKSSTDAGPHGPTAGPQRNTPGTPGYSSSASVIYGDKGDFSIVYRRASGAPAHKPEAKSESH
jgi:hypothetical protein